MIRTKLFARAAIALALGACSSTGRTAEATSSAGALQLVYIVTASGGG
jgi:hypothetical protein